MPEIKIIAFDYDRVLTDQNLKFDERLIHYFKFMKTLGIFFGINTGRRWNYISHMQHLVDFIIYENGYFLYYKEKIPLYNSFDEKIAYQIKNKIRENDLNCVEGEMAVSCPIIYMDILSNIFNDDNTKLIPNVDRIFILPKRIDKGNAINELLKILNIKNDNLCVVGDGENDIDMFRVAGFPASLANSVKELKNISKFVSNRSYSDGTIDILEKLKNLNFKY
ncbi:MAG: HAD-IIB family hydrolase [Thermoplasmata archaeon]|jgi:phosphoglycolate phosphatase (TIGR01487 family)|nr:HAD-IIB family hydrolase [Thermoplasmata archaeon]